jgi:hypothetical protein
MITDRLRIRQKIAIKLPLMKSIRNIKRDGQRKSDMATARRKRKELKGLESSGQRRYMEKLNSEASEEMTLDRIGGGGCMRTIPRRKRRAQETERHQRKDLQ